MIGVVFTDDKILIAELEGSNSRKSPKVKKLEQLTLDKSELVNLAIFNQRKISNFINKFITNNKLQNLPVVFCLDGSKLSEFYNTAPECDNKVGCDCQNCKIYNTTRTNLDGTNYYCQISYPILFQYKLLAINTGINLISIITDIVAIKALLNNREDNVPGLNKNSRNKLKKYFNNEQNKQDSYALNQLLGIYFVKNKK